LAQLANDQNIDNSGYKGTIQQYLLDPTNYPLEIVGNWIIEQFATSIHKTGD
jgi:hypothetical protein